MYDKFMELCMIENFDTKEASLTLSQINISKEFVHSPKCKGRVYSPMPFTPLSMAVFYCNLPMVKMLLSLGADPNVVYDRDKSVLWELQYNAAETDVKNEIRLAIVKLLLENGADPKITIEGEDLYHYVLAVSQDDLGRLADYRRRFLDLLEEYIDN